MARLLRETAWRDLQAGDRFRIQGVPRRRFRFVAYVTNFENGAVHVEAVDERNGGMRAFPPDRPFVKERRSRGGAGTPG